MCDAIDNCPAVANINQVDNDNDGMGDVCDDPDCGNGFVELGEACDDGNVFISDGCESCNVTT